MLKEEFGGKMTTAMLNQLDFEMNDMLIDRLPDLEFPKLKPKRLEDAFSSGTDTEDKLIIAAKQKSGSKAHVDEV
ncbi:hypothetical protein DPMN_124072 [Dreissena polymorpha]|uniref:Uncharacterized protein n=1 Tax=Dreissena polymorpha TaxID=45954 RepID=A0A9D4GUZ7_DREPO|nr:hypothetical protein DPMN_124072 [Dreissena polymorpha]